MNPSDPAFERTYQAARGFFELEMFTDAWNELEELRPEWRPLAKMLLLRVMILNNLKKWKDAAIIAEGSIRHYPEFGALYLAGAGPCHAELPRADGCEDAPFGGRAVAVKPTFRTAFKKRRCIIPADGFYEWQKAGGAKIPHRMTVGDGLFFFAGLWETWRDPETPDGEPLRTCTIITTTPNAITAPIHDRMPVILPPAAQEAWMARETTLEHLQALLVPHSPEGMRAYRVSTDVGKVQNQAASLIEPAEAD